MEKFTGKPLYQPIKWILYYCHGCTKIFLQKKKNWEEDINTINCKYCKNEFIEKIDEKFTK